MKNVLWYIGLFGCVLAGVGLLWRAIATACYYWPFVVLVILGIHRSSSRVVLVGDELSDHRFAERMAYVLAIVGATCMVLSNVHVENRLFTLWGDLNTNTGLFWHGVNGIIALKCCLDCRKHDVVIDIIAS